MLFLVIFIFLYACETWTLTAEAELEKTTQAFEIKCYRRLMIILYKDHITSSQKDPSSQETEAKAFWPRLHVVWFSKDDSTRHCERK